MSAVIVTSNLSADIPLRKVARLGGPNHLPRTVVTESGDCERGVLDYPGCRYG